MKVQTNFASLAIQNVPRKKSDQTAPRTAQSDQNLHWVYVPVGTFSDVDAHMTIMHEGNMILALLLY